MKHPLAKAPYPLVCTGLGLVLGWAPKLVRGPIRGRFDVRDIERSIAVWTWYPARLSIGFWVGVAVWPRPWWLRGALCGSLAMRPGGFVALGTPGCGFG